MARNDAPLWAIGDRLVTIVEVRPDYWRYMDCLTDELIGQAFTGKQVKAAIKYLNNEEGKQ